MPTRALVRTLLLRQAEGAHLCWFSDFLTDDFPFVLLVLPDRLAQRIALQLSELGIIDERAAGYKWERTSSSANSA